MTAETSSRRITWIAFGAIALLHVAYIANIHLSHSPGTFSVHHLVAGGDTNVYIQSGIRHTHREPLFRRDPWPDVFPYLYHPLFACVFAALDPLGARIIGLLVFALE